MKLLFLILITCWMLPEGIDKDHPPKWPQPPPAPNRLFYIQRSSNANTIVYDAQLGAKGRFNPDKPVVVYWLRYAEQGQRQELSWIQRTLAYGLSRPELLGEELVTNWVSYRKRPLHLTIDADGHPVARIQINNRMAQLRRVFVQVGDSARANPKIAFINYIDLYGQDIKTRQPVHERFVP